MTKLKDKITLKKLKLVKSRSQETHCFTATVCIDGVAICEADNGGYGGDTSYNTIGKAPGSQNDLYKEIALIDAELGKEVLSSHGFDIPNSLDIVISELINTMSLEKEVKSLIRRRICYTDATGAIYEMAAKFKPTAENFAKVAKTDWWKSTNTFLKDMSMADACKALRG